MFKHKQLRAVVIQPALNLIGLYSVDAEELLIATCAIESYGGTYLVQSGGGPAKGIFQMESTTHDDLWHRLEKRYPDLLQRVLNGCGYLHQPSADALITNLLYASMMARLLYFIRIPHGLATDNSSIDILWTQYKQYWNTRSGKATKEHFLNTYYHFIGGHQSKK
jgi:hypothetical protein